VRDGGRVVVSDDTQMTLFTGAGLAAAFANKDLANIGAVVECIRRAYLEWYATQHGRYADVDGQLFGRVITTALRRLCTESREKSEIGLRHGPASAYRA
jgi:hypothetical protein